MRSIKFFIQLLLCVVLSASISCLCLWLINSNNPKPFSVYISYFVLTLICNFLLILFSISLCLAEGREELLNSIFIAPSRHIVFYIAWGGALGMLPSPLFAPTLRAWPMVASLGAIGGASAALFFVVFDLIFHRRPRHNNAFLLTMRLVHARLGRN